MIELLLRINRHRFEFWPTFFFPIRSRQCSTISQMRVIPLCVGNIITVDLTEVMTFRFVHAHIFRLFFSLSLSLPLSLFAPVLNFTIKLEMAIHTRKKNNFFFKPNKIFDQTPNWPFFFLVQRQRQQQQVRMKKKMNFIETYAVNSPKRKFLMNSRWFLFCSTKKNGNKMIVCFQNTRKRTLTHTLKLDSSIIFFGQIFLPVLFYSSFLIFDRLFLSLSLSLRFFHLDFLSLKYSKCFRNFTRNSMRKPFAMHGCNDLLWNYEQKKMSSSLYV